MVRLIRTPANMGGSVGGMLNWVFWVNCCSAELGGWIGGNVKMGNMGGVGKLHSCRERGLQQGYKVWHGICYAGDSVSCFVAAK